jgi:hypothetical protein
LIRSDKCAVMAPQVVFGFDVLGELELGSVSQDADPVQVRAAGTTKHSTEDPPCGKQRQSSLLANAAEQLPSETPTNADFQTTQLPKEQGGDVVLEHNSTACLQALSNTSDIDATSVEIKSTKTAAAGQRVDQSGKEKSSEGVTGQRNESDIATVDNEASSGANVTHSDMTQCPAEPAVEARVHTVLNGVSIGADLKKASNVLTVICSSPCCDIPLFSCPQRLKSR